MPIRSTHTFAVLEVSPDAYVEIEAKLKAAGYDHVFIEDKIAMHGIALAPGLPYGKDTRFRSEDLEGEEKELFPMFNAQVILDKPGGRRMAVSLTKEDADVICLALNRLYEGGHGQ